MPIRRSQKKRNAEPRQKQNQRRLVIDPMVNPGSSAHRHQARSKAHPTRPHHRMVSLAQNSPGDRSARTLQGKTTTVMLGAVAATPLELLNQRWSAVYTSPQATHLSVAFGEATASWTPTSTLSFNGVGYYRQFWQAHTDGNGTDGQPCDPSGALLGQLCIGDGNTPINQNFGVLDTLSPNAFLGEIDRNWTSTAS